MSSGEKTNESSNPAWFEDVARKVHSIDWRGFDGPADHDPSKVPAAFVQLLQADSRQAAFEAESVLLSAIESASAGTCLPFTEAVMGLLCALFDHPSAHVQDSVVGFATSLVRFGFPESGARRVPADPAVLDLVAGSDALWRLASTDADLAPNLLLAAAIEPDLVEDLEYLALIWGSSPPALTDAVRQLPRPLRATSVMIGATQLNEGWLTVLGSAVPPELSITRAINSAREKSSVLTHRFGPKGKDLDRVSRRPIPVVEAWWMTIDLRQQLGAVTTIPSADGSAGP
jgi:hypothetical protein